MSGYIDRASFKKYAEISERTLKKIKRIPETDKNNPELKRLFRQYILVNRFMVRFLTSEISYLDEYNRQIKHLKWYAASDKIKNQLNAFICKQEKRIDKLSAVLQTIGENITLALDCWQLYGADYPELFELCGADISKFIKTNGHEALLEMPSFGATMFTYNIDYRGEGDFIKFDNDGPLTHAVLAYFRSLIGTTAFDKACHTTLNGLMQKKGHESWKR